MEILTKGAIKNFTVDDPYVDVKVEYYDNTKGVLLCKEEIETILKGLSIAIDTMAFDGNFNSTYHELMDIQSEIKNAISRLK